MYLKVLALITYPDLINSNEFPEDAKARARDILKGCKGRCGPEIFSRDAKVGAGL